MDELCRAIYRDVVWWRTELSLSEVGYIGWDSDTGLELSAIGYNDKVELLFPGLVCSIWTRRGILFVAKIW